MIKQLIQQQKWNFKNLIQKLTIVLKELKKKENQDCKDHLVYNMTWKFFLTIMVVYMIYISLRTCIILLIGCDDKNCFDAFYYVTNFAVGPIPLVIHYIVFSKIKDIRHQSQIINFTFLLFQISSLVYIYFGKQKNSEQFILYSLTQVKFFYFCQCLISELSFRVLSIFLEFTFFTYLLSDQIEIVFLNTFVSIIVMILYESFYYQLIQQHRLQFQTLQNLPCGICIIGQQGQKILHTNSQMRELIEKNCPSTSPEKFTSFLKSSQLYKTSVFQQICMDEKSNFEFCHFVSRLYVHLDQVTTQMPLLCLQFQDSNQQPKEKEHLVDLQSILKYMADEVDSVQKKDNSNFQFKCVFIDRPDGNKIDQPIKISQSRHEILIEVRIKGGFQFQYDDAIMITFYDISQTLKSLYYKSLNNFKSKMIKSISHELRTRLNIIQGMIEIVLNTESLSLQAKKLLDASFQNCKIQALIIGSIIDYHLIQEKKLYAINQKCMIADVIQDSIRLFKEEFILKNLSIKFINNLEEKSQIEVDQQRLLSVLVHLISNSLKFTNRGTIIISVTQHRQKLNQSQQMERKFYSCMSSENVPLELFSKKRISLSHHFQQISPIKIQDLKLQQNIKKLSKSPSSSIKEIIYKIEIKDTGLGMNPTQLRRVLDILQSESDYGDDANELTSSSDGSMMGIRVSNQLLKYLNNDETIQFLTIKSQENQGTTVTFYLRTLGTSISRDHIDSIADEETIKRKFEVINSPLTSFNMDYRNQLIYDGVIKNRGNVTSLKTICKCDEDILIVDDEPYNLLVLATLMQQFQQNTIQAYDGKSCVELVNARMKNSISANHDCGVFKAILMDYQMPLMNGRQAAEIINNMCTENKFNNIPIFGITGFSSEEDIKALERAGMIKVYIKPISKQMLREILNKIKELKEQSSSFQVSDYGHISLDQIVQDDQNLSF